MTDEVEYEEWIYGTPPQDVDFVRFVGEEVVRVETMKVDGQKTVRVEKEVDLGEATLAKKQPAERPANAPTLRRPGEEMPEATTSESVQRAADGRANATARRAPGPGNDPGPNCDPGEFCRIDLH